MGLQGLAVSPEVAGMTGGGTDDPRDHPSTILAPVEVVSPHWRCEPVQGTKSLLPIRGLTRISRSARAETIVSIGVEFTTRVPVNRLTFSR